MQASPKFHLKPSGTSLDKGCRSPRLPAYSARINRPGILICDLLAYFLGRLVRKTQDLSFHTRKVLPEVAFSSCFQFPSLRLVPRAFFCWLLYFGDKC